MGQRKNNGKTKPSREWLRKWFAWVCGSIGTMAFLALLTYNPTDPSWTVANGSEAANIMGIAGAYFADTLYQSLGYIAWVAPVMCGILARRLALNITPFFGGIYSAMWLPVIIGSSTILATLETFPILPVPEGNGGIIGRLISEKSLFLLGYYGSYVIWGTIILSCLVIASKHSILKTVANIFLQLKNRGATLSKP